MGRRVRRKFNIKKTYNQVRRTYGKAKTFYKKNRKHFDKAKKIGETVYKNRKKIGQGIKYVKKNRKKKKNAVDGEESGIPKKKKKKKKPPMGNDSSAGGIPAKPKRGSKPEKRKKKKEKTRDKINRLREEYSHDDLERTPEMGETMADFYSRTATYWASEVVKVAQATTDGGNATVNASAELSAKELRARGFDLARERYEELKPVLDSLMDLEAHQKEKKQKKNTMTI